MTWSTSWGAVCAMRRAPQEGLQPTPLAAVGDEVDGLAVGTSGSGLQPTPLAAVGDELVVAAVATAQAQEAVGQDAALEEGVELVLDEVRQDGAGGLLGLGEEALWAALIARI